MAEHLTKDSLAICPKCGGHYNPRLDKPCAEPGDDALAKPVTAGLGVESAPEARASVTGGPLSSKERFTCQARNYTGPDPQDCDAPFCGCNPAWSECIEMLQECGLLKDRRADETFACPECPRCKVEHWPHCPEKT